MSSSGDNFIYSSANATTNKFAGSYQDKQWFYNVDNQNGNYTNQITFSLNSFFSESDKFVSLSEAFLAIPMVASVTKSGGPAVLSRNDFILGLKNSHLNLINSFSLEIDGKTKCQSSNFINIPCIFKQLTSMSYEEMKTNGVGFLMDDSSSWHYNGGSSPVGGNARTTTNPFSCVDSACGNGIINNVIAQTNDATSVYNTGSKSNGGLLERIRANNFSPFQHVNSATVWTNNAGAIRNISSIQNELKSYTLVNSGANDAVSYQAFYYVAIIKLKDLTDIFNVDAMSLMKAVNLNLTLNLNVGNFNISQKFAGDANDVFRCSMVGAAQSSFNYTCPLIACPQTIPFGTSDSTITYGLYIQNVTNLGITNQTSYGIPKHVMPQARLYAPLVNLKPSLASLYLQNNQQKLVKYTDVYSTQILNISAGGIVNFTVSQGLVNARQLLVVPFISGSVNGAVPTANAGTLANATFSPLISPFTTEPSTTSPLLQLAEFGVSMGGKEMISTRNTYGFEQFLEQFYECNKVNGGLGRPVFNGLISKADWENMYRYYIVDLSRGQDEDDSTPKDIRLFCRNDNLLSIDLYVFVLQTKKFVVNVSTGKLTDNVVSANSLE